MVDEDSHSTDSSVSGEEGHSTILLAQFIFLVFKTSFKAKKDRNKINVETVNASMFRLCF